MKDMKDTASNSEKRLEGPDANTYLAEMIRLYGGLVRHICRNALGDRPEDIDECVSDVFVALWENVTSGRCDPRAQGVKQYLCGIARNKAIDRYRKLAARPAVSLDEVEAGGLPLRETLSEPDFAETLARGDDAEALAEAVAALPPKSREVFVLRYCYLERVGAIAKKLGLTDKAVENILYRGKLSLRQKLAGSGFSKEDQPLKNYAKENCEVIIYG
jgi:RNA polymerase sigma-70 factor (ECF subfamily)